MHQVIDFTLAKSIAFSVDIISRRMKAWVLSHTGTSWMSLVPVYSTATPLQLDWYRSSMLLAKPPLLSCGQYKTWTMKVHILFNGCIIGDVEMHLL